MKYFVISENGNKFGPADLTMLNQWISEGRILRATQLVDEQTGQIFAADTVPGLIFAQTAPPPNWTAAPSTESPNPDWSPPHTDYPRSVEVKREGDGYVITAWILGICGLFGMCCCPFVVIFPLFGFVLANAARRKGNANGLMALYFNLAVLVLGLGYAVLTFGSLMMPFNWD